MDAKRTARAHRRHPLRMLRRRLILSASMIILALLAGEIAVRVFVPVRSVGPVATTYDPIYGKRLKRSYWCRRIGPEMSYVLTTNSLGFRGPEPTGPITGSVIFLGDSFTMGSAVNDGEEFPALVRARLDDRFGPEAVPVINAGVANTGNGRWVKFLRDEAPRYAPRFIVMQFFVNDFADNVNERLFGLDADGTLVENPVPPIRRSADPPIRRSADPIGSSGSWRARRFWGTRTSSRWPARPWPTSSTGTR